MFKPAFAILIVLGLLPALPAAAETDSQPGWSPQEQARLQELLPVQPGEFQATVVVFASPRCRICTLYAPRLRQLAEEWNSRQVALVAVVPPLHGLDGPEEFRQRHGWTFPVITDRDHELGKLLDVQVVPEVLVLDSGLRLPYRGAIDDQYLLGGQRSAASREYLCDAVEAVLQGELVAFPRTTPLGCRINRGSAPANGAVTYARDVAPILQRHCLNCHRPGQSAPFSLLDYEEARDWAEMICDVVQRGLMPPWHANPDFGTFANANVLSERQKQTLRDWLAAGCPAGDPADLPSAPEFPEEWQIGEPDRILSLPEFTIPAEGIVEYKYVTLDPEFITDQWVTAVEVRAGNRTVLHHCSIYLENPRGQTEKQGTLGSIHLTGQAMGTPPAAYPPGAAKKIPAGYKLLVVLHYQAVGSVQVDRSRIGLRLARPGEVKQEVATLALVPPFLRIPPRVDNHRVEVDYHVARDVQVLTLYPHMHLRGRNVRFQAHYPDGSLEILLDVPRWDFNWQNRYQLQTPKTLPVGTILRAVAHYDNSAGNPFNPDPDAVVVAGEQSTDEMFNGFVDVVEASQDLTDWQYRSRSWVEQRSLLFWCGCGGSLALAGCLFVLRRRRAGPGPFSLWPR